MSLRLVTTAPPAPRGSPSPRSPARVMLCAPRDHPRTVIVHGGVYRVTARWSWDGRLGHGALVGNVASGQLRDGASGRRSAADGVAAGARPGGARPPRAGGAPAGAAGES